MIDNKQGTTQFCTQCEAKGKENTSLIEEVEKLKKQAAEMQAYGCFIPDKDSGVRCSVADQNAALLKRCEKAEADVVRLTKLSGESTMALAVYRKHLECHYTALLDGIDKELQALSQKGQSEKDCKACGQCDGPLKEGEWR